MYESGLGRSCMRTIAQSGKYTPVHHFRSLSLTALLRDHPTIITNNLTLSHLLTLPRLSSLSSLLPGPFLLATNLWIKLDSFASAAVEPFWHSGEIPFRLQGRYVELVGS